MGDFAPADLRRVARLACLELDDAEAERLARDLAVITASFGDLAAFARELPDATEEEPGALREDAVEAFPDADALLANAPRVDASRALRSPRGPA